MKNSILALFILVFTAGLLFCSSRSKIVTQPPEKAFPVDHKIVKTDKQWKLELDPEVYNITRNKGTERAFTGKYWNNKEDGVYTCSNCDLELFYLSSINSQRSQIARKLQIPIPVLP
ncbi:MAG: peptide-methionine (R)-S-oxide reductase [Bacteroidetes bacterium]|nr:peptide-methionine (R)-S-oxide reductase [Bacteroidota bacterium]